MPSYIREGHWGVWDYVEETYHTDDSFFILLGLHAPTSHLTRWNADEAQGLGRVVVVDEIHDTVEDTEAALEAYERQESYRDTEWHLFLKHAGVGPDTTFETILATPRRHYVQTP